MHILTIPEGISEPIPVAGGTPLEAGKSYICSNAFAGALLSSNWRVVIDGEMWALRKLLKAVHLPDVEFDPSLNWNGLHIWLMRGGGWGDLLMLTPLIRELKRRWPECVVHVARGDIHTDIFYGLDVIEESIPIEGITNGILISFEDWIEGHPGAEKVHMAQHFANRLMIDLDRDYRPSYTIKSTEAARVLYSLPKTKKRIGVQYMASAIYRTYPFVEEVIDRLLKHDVEVVIFGQKGQLKMKEGTPPELINLTAMDFSFRQSVAVAATCDCIISPDSAMVHVASALEVPYVGLYGPIPPRLRGSGKEGRGIQGMAECSPCFFHATRADEFPAGMPCSKTGYCVALAQIAPEQVVETAMRLASPIITLDTLRLPG